MKTVPSPYICIYMPSQTFVGSSSTHWYTPASQMFDESSSNWYTPPHENVCEGKDWMRVGREDEESSFCVDSITVLLSLFPSYPPLPPLSLISVLLVIYTALLYVPLSPLFPLLVHNMYIERKYRNGKIYVGGFDLALR